MEEGLVDQLPPDLGAPYPNLVCAVDDDGNEVAGIRLPDITVPLGTHTGWNLRHPDNGGPGQTIGLSGSTIPFPASKAEREEKGDPRLSIEERYPSREDYLSQVQQAAQTLTDERYLLPEDIALLVSHATERYEALIAGHPPRARTFSAIPKLDTPVKVMGASRNGLCYILAANSVR